MHYSHSRQLALFNRKNEKEVSGADWQPLLWSGQLPDHLWDIVKNVLPKKGEASHKDYEESARKFLDRIFDTVARGLLLSDIYVGDKIATDYFRERFYKWGKKGTIEAIFDALKECPDFGFEIVENRIVPKDTLVVSGGMINLDARLGLLLGTRTGGEVWRAPSRPRQPIDERGITGLSEWVVFEKTKELNSHVSLIRWDGTLPDHLWNIGKVVLPYHGRGVPQSLYEARTKDFLSVVLDAAARGISLGEICVEGEDADYIRKRFYEWGTKGIFREFFEALDCRNDFGFEIVDEKIVPKSSLIVTSGKVNISYRPGLFLGTRTGVCGQAERQSSASVRLGRVRAISHMRKKINEWLQTPASTRMHVYHVAERIMQSPLQLAQHVLEIPRQDITSRDVGVIASVMQENGFVWSYYEPRKRNAWLRQSVPLVWSGCLPEHFWEEARHTLPTLRCKRSKSAADSCKNFMNVVLDATARGLALSEMGFGKVSQEIHERRFIRWGGGKVFHDFFEALQNRSDFGFEFKNGAIFPKQELVVIGGGVVQGARPGLLLREKSGGEEKITDESVSPKKIFTSCMWELVRPVLPFGDLFKSSHGVNYTEKFLENYIQAVLCAADRGGGLFQIFTDSPEIAKKLYNLTIIWGEEGYWDKIFQVLKTRPDFNFVLAGDFIVRKDLACLTESSDDGDPGPRIRRHRSKQAPGFSFGVR